jgi:stearoyl-CoA desaturase (delta-9 desaturase)
MWFWVYVVHAIAIVSIGYLVGLATMSSHRQALWLAASWFTWGVIARTIFTLHVSWAVNSVCHTWGYRNYETRDESTNSWWVALFTFGEGWHNNHHADQRSAQHGHRWFELDPSWWAINLMAKAGLAWNLIGPRQALHGQIQDE